MKTKRVVILLGFIAAVIGGIVFLILVRAKKPDFSFDGMPQGEMAFAMREGMTTAGGVTSVGVTEEVFGVENLSVDLEIEEVYIRAEDTVTEGTRILKLSEASVAQAREELEQALKEADLAYRSGLIEFEQSRITAKYDLDRKVLSGEQAKEIYDENLSGLQESVHRAREQLSEAQEEIAEYQSYVSDDSYRSYFKVDEYQTLYDETLGALMEKMEEWGVSWSQVTGQGGSMNMAGMTSAVSQGTVSGGDAAQSAGPSRDQIQVLASLYNVLEKQLRNLEQAKEDYENALVNAAFELQTLELQLPELEQAVEEAEKNYQSRVLQEKVTYEKALATADSAQSDYEAAVWQAETACEVLERDREDAEENLALFKTSVGDGYFHASGDGTVLRTMVRAGRNLTSESVVFVYSNPEEMTVAVSVGQEDIAKIALGDEVYIQTGEYGGFEGIVEEIYPVSDSESRTNVTYSVVIRFTGDTTAVPANESVTVVFGMDAEGIQNAISMWENSGKGGQPPEGMELPEGTELPEGMELPEGTELPEGETLPRGSGMPQGNRPGNRNFGN